MPPKIAVLLHQELRHKTKGQEYGDNELLLSDSDNSIIESV